MVIAVLFQLDDRDPPFDPPNGRFHGLRALQVESRGRECPYILESWWPRNADQLCHGGFHNSRPQVLAVDDVLAHQIAVVILTGLNLPALRTRRSYHLGHR